MNNSNENCIRLGSRVRTIMGAGTVVGFECFRPSYYGYPSGVGVESTKQRDSRVVVALDDPSQWSLSYDKNGNRHHPYMANRDILEVDR